MIESKLFLPADAAIISGNRECGDRANSDLIAGPAWTIVDGKKILACGGVRVLGIGEAWFLASEEAKSDKLMAVMRIVKEKLKEMRAAEKLYRIFAENEISENFLKHLGFEKKDNIFVR